MSASRRRRFYWRVHVKLYTSCMLLNFCNAVYNEAWTLTKSSKNFPGVIFNRPSPWYSNETWRRQSKVFLWTILWKWKLMLKVSYGTSLQIWLTKRMVQWKISTAYTVITAYKAAKLKRTKTLSARRICHTFWMFGKHAGKFQYSSCSSVSTL